MPLKLRLTGVSSGIDKDRPDYTVYCGGWGCWSHLRDPRWFRQSALVLVDERQRATLESRGHPLEEAKAQFQKSWDEWKAWAKLE
jgi:hypothetical protein